MPLRVYFRSFRSVAFLQSRSQFSYPSVACRLLSRLYSNSTMAADAEPRRKAMAAVNDIFDRYKLLAKNRAVGRKYYDEDVMQEVKLLDAGPEGSVLFELVMDAKYSNLNDVMHGGAAGVIFDMCTTTALGPLARPDFYFFLGGVTRTLSISYLRAIPIGETVHIRSWVVSAGRTMAFIRSEMTSVDGKKVYCTCEHHKVNIEAKKEHLEVETDLDREVKRIIKKEKL